LPLDWFVLFSSATALWGAPGQAHYAAGNAALDTLAAERHARGEPALSVAWGPWADAGMAKDDFREMLERFGIQSFSRDEGVAVLERLLGAAVPHAVAVKADWAAFRPFYEAQTGRRILEALGPATRVEISANGELRDRLKSLHPVEHADAVLEYVRVTAGLVLGGSALPNPRAQARDLGFDSLLAVDFCKKLGIGVGRTLPLTLLFEYPTLERVAEHLTRDVLRLKETVPSANGHHQVEFDMAVDGLSDDEILAELNQHRGV
jgi:hypothetical protein